jgi:arginine utilization protein RocB
VLEGSGIALSIKSALSLVVLKGEIMNTEILDGIEKDIADIFYRLVAIKSDTNSVYEKDVEAFFRDYFSNIDYFKKNKEYYGAYPIINDPLYRAVSWGLVKGKGAETVVLVNHNDVVDIEDFKAYKPYAYSPDELAKALYEVRLELPEDVREDLESGGYIFGRGAADMKAGAAIQLALVKKYSELKDFNGNVLYLSVPDEENVSAGMRSAIDLMMELREKYGVDYIYTINSEPHQRTQAEVGVLSEGSVGKVMPFVYVRGYLSHAGKVFEGFNPVNLLSAIVNRTELNLTFSDVVGGEASPPPTWLYFKDSKVNYDVSMPLSACGYMSVHTLCSCPIEVMDKIKTICLQSFQDTIEYMNSRYKDYRNSIGAEYEPLPWKLKVLTYKELYQEAEENYPERFVREYYNKLVEAEEMIRKGERTLADINFELIEFIFNYINDLSPKVVIGLAPPYYPSVSIANIKNLDRKYRELPDQIIEFAMKSYNQAYTTVLFFTGISDLSYTYMENSEAVIRSLEEGMPMLGTLYTLPLAKIEKLSMPSLNIGPWGKDYHKLTERVLKEDLLQRTPALLNYAISKLLS